MYVCGIKCLFPWVGTINPRSKDLVNVTALCHLTPVSDSFPTASLDYVSHQGSSFLQMRMALLQQSNHVAGILQGFSHALDVVRMLLTPQSKDFLALFPHLIAMKSWTVFLVLINKINGSSVQGELAGHCWIAACVSYVGFVVCQLTLVYSVERLI